MGMFEEMDRYGTKTPPDDFDKPFFKTGAGIFVIALAVFVLLWAMFAFVIPALFPGDLMLH